MSRNNENSTFIDEQLDICFFGKQRKTHKKIFDLAGLSPEALLVPNSWGI